MFSETAAKTTAKNNGIVNRAKIFEIIVIIVKTNMIRINRGTLTFNSKSSFNLKNRNFVG